MEIKSEKEILNSYDEGKDREFIYDDTYWVKLDNEIGGLLQDLKRINTCLSANYIISELQKQSRLEAKKIVRDLIKKLTKSD